MIAENDVKSYKRYPLTQEMHDRKRPKIRTMAHRDDLVYEINVV